MRFFPRVPDPSILQHCSPLLSPLRGYWCVGEGGGKPGRDQTLAPRPHGGRAGEQQVVWGCASESPSLRKSPEAAMRGWGPPGDVWGQGPWDCGSARPSPTSEARSHRTRAGRVVLRQQDPAPWASEATPHGSLPATMSPSGLNRKRARSRRATCLGLWAFRAHLPPHPLPAQDLAQISKPSRRLPSLTCSRF